MSDFVEDKEIEALDLAEWSLESVADFLTKHPEWCPVFDKNNFLYGVEYPALKLADKENANDRRRETG